MAKKKPRSTAEPTPRTPAEVNPGREERESRDFSQRAFDVVREATRRHEDDTSEE